MQFAFLKCLFVILLVCLLSFLLQVSPSMYFDEASTLNFPLATTIGMNLARYMQVPTKSRVCGFASRYTTSTTGVWQPGAHDP